VCTDLKICTQLEKKCSRFSLVFLAVILGDFFRESSGKNPSHPQKLACSYTYATDLTEGLKCERSGLAELTPHKTRASTGLQTFYFLQQLQTEQKVVSAGGVGGGGAGCASAHPKILIF